MDRDKPIHPGEFISEVYLHKFKVSKRHMARCLEVSPNTFNNLLNEESAVSPEMAIRLEIGFGRTAESWLRMQTDFDLYLAKLNLDISNIQLITNKT